MKTLLNRRGFIKKLVLAIIGVEFSYLFYDAFRKKKEDDQGAQWYEVGPVANLEANTIYPYHSGHFYLSVLGNMGMMAFSVKCTHLGCVIHAQKEGFVCPCHASSFDKYGEVKSAPATRALDTFDIKIEKDILYVNNSQARKRTQFEKSQITYA